MKQKLFYVEYDDSQKGCPVHFGGKYFKNNEWTGEHEWEFNDPNPFHYQITSKYSLKINENILELDYCDSYVSDKFLQILDLCKIQYRAIPLTILLRGNKHANKSYFFLLPAGRVFLLDKEKSTNYTVVRNPDNPNEFLHEEYFPNEFVYETIENFYIKDNENFPDFFICGELNKVICTEHFKNLCEIHHMIGVKFTGITNGFYYNSWE